MLPSQHLNLFLQISNSSFVDNFSYSRLFLIFMLSLATEKKSISDRVPNEIHRVAIDSAGRVGSLYDGHRDCVLQRSKSFKKEETFHWIQPRQCEIKYNQNDCCSNILKIMNIQKELRLSILLDMSKKTETNTFIDYYQPISEYTRFILYSCIYREEKLPDHPVKTETMDESMFVSAATHIVTKVHYGIRLAIVVQLPTDPNTVLAIDNVLQTLCNRLQDHRSVYLLTVFEKSVLEKISYTKVYSNISQFRNLSKIWDVCCMIQRNEYYLAQYPISYILRPINDFFPEERIQFNPLPEELNEKIENYVLQLKINVKKIENSVTRDMPKFLCEHLKRSFNKIETQWCDVKKKFTNEIQRLSNLVVLLRSSTADNLIILETLNDNQQMILQIGITQLTQNIKDLEEKEYFIRSLKQRRFQYLNAEVYKVTQTDNKEAMAQKLGQNHEHYRILCSNDCLNKKNSAVLEKLILDLTEELKNKPHLYLIYADFSDSTLQLTNIMVI